MVGGKVPLSKKVIKWDLPTCFFISEEQGPHLPPRQMIEQVLPSQDSWLGLVGGMNAQ